MSIAAISTFCKSKSSVTIFEALSASAIRSVRYAKEIPVEQLRIVANDLDPEAVKTIESNIELNQLQDKIKSSCGDAK
jgi:tRNA (guanine26-N2/guanine27-N2)-dimethyltransferase